MVSLVNFALILVLWAQGFEKWDYAIWLSVCNREKNTRTKGDTESWNFELNLARHGDLVIRENKN